SQEIESAAFGSNVYAVWENSTTGTANAPRYIELATSHDNGTTFTYQPLGKGISREPELSVSPFGFLFVLWRIQNVLGTPTTSTMMIAKSTNNGTTFGQFQNVSGYGIAREGKIIAVGSNVYVSWRFPAGVTNDFEVFTATSKDNGTTYSSPLNISGTTGIFDLSSEQNDPEIISNGPVLEVSWNSNLNGVNDLFIARSTNFGMNFTNYLVDSGTSINGQLVASWQDDFYYLWNLNNSVRFCMSG
ncbi:MAG: hypothetical protein OK439_03600, partial [Thaumarchaeota archaeon]|nr:hypothetical protein [Nitrososphaerota archaeon]